MHLLCPRVQDSGQPDCNIASWMIPESSYAWGNNETICCGDPRSRLCGDYEADSCFSVSLKMNWLLSSIGWMWIVSGQLWAAEFACTVLSPVFHLPFLGVYTPTWITVQIGFTWHDNVCNDVYTSQACPGPKWTDNSKDREKLYLYMQGQAWCSQLIPLVLLSKFYPMQGQAWCSDPLLLCNFQIGHLSSSRLTISVVSTRGPCWCW